MEAVVHDQVANVELAGEIVVDYLDWCSVACGAHRIQNCIECALTDVGRNLEKLFAACRAMVSHLNRITVACHASEDQQQAQGVVQPLKVVQDVATRWNSCYYMAVCLLQLQTPIIVVLGQDKDRAEVVCQAVGSNWRSGGGFARSGDCHNMAKRRLFPYPFTTSATDSRFATIFQAGR